MAAKPALKPFQGFVQVYTGNGKGKTTAALGLALRAAGHGFRTFIGQFLKGRPSGELTAVKNLEPLITMVQFGRQGFIQVTETPDNEDISCARLGLEKCLEAMLSNEYRIIILDEINTAVHFKLLEEDAVLDLLGRRPPDVEVILTGRYAPTSFIDRADLVTEMKELKHYYARGIRARDGVER